MSRGADTRFPKGRSGNPGGRPRQRRPHISAFDIIFDKTITVTQNGVQRELTIDEALQLQTYRAALQGSKMAVRAVLKMIEMREAALARLAHCASSPIKVIREHDSLNAHEAMRILGIAGYDQATPRQGWQLNQLRLATWATQLALSRPGRQRYSAADIQEINHTTLASHRLSWPRATRT